MKNLIKLSYLLITLVMLTTSCRTEDEEIINPPTEEAIEANSTIADLLNKVSQNDGSFDNIIDGASCFSIQLPVTVIVNGVEVEVTSSNDYQTIEDIFEQSDTDTDTLEIVFPITVIFNDYTTADVNSYGELLALAAQCPDENSPDEDIECIDIQYPITAAIFNSNNEQIDTIVITSDEELYEFIEDLDDYDAVTIEFPITVILADGTTTEVTSLQELAIVIENAENDCDEDDDNDYDDDDCNNCDTNQLTTILTECPSWYIDKLERNDNDLEDNYTSYEFEFTQDGMIFVTNSGTTTVGSWNAIGEGNNINVTIEVPGIPDINDIWILHEIDQDDDVEVDLRIGDDRLRFECGLNNDDDDDNDDAESDLITALTADNALWVVGLYEEEGSNETSDYNDFVFEFNSDGTVTVSGAEDSTGIWGSLNNGTEMLLNFGPEAPLEELNDDDWEVLSVSENEVQLRDVSGGNGGTDLLTLTRV